MLHLLACLPLLPGPIGTQGCRSHTVGLGAVGPCQLRVDSKHLVWPSHPDRLPMAQQLWLFGDLPLGSRSADPHSTAVWCGNLLHSSPQPHIAGCLLFTRWSTRYCNQDLHQKTLRSGAIPTGSAISHVLSTQRCSALLPQRWRTVRQIQLH